MWRIVIKEVHPNHDAEESGDLWHAHSITCLLSPGKHATGGPGETGPTIPLHPGFRPGFGARAGISREVKV